MHLNILDRTQSTLIKAALCIRKRSHNTPLLEAIHVQRVKSLTQKRTLGLIKQIFTNPSGATRFYTTLLNNDCKTNSLLSRAISTCKSLDVPILKVLFTNDFYDSHTFTPPGHYGLVDSLRVVLQDDSFYLAHNHGLLQLLLLPF